MKKVLYLTKRSGGGPLGPTTTFSLELSQGNVRTPLNITSFGCEEDRHRCLCYALPPKASYETRRPAEFPPETTETAAIRKAYHYAAAQATAISSLSGLELIDETGLKTCAQTQPKCTERDNLLDLTREYDEAPLVAPAQTQSSCTKENVPKRRSIVTIDESSGRSPQIGSDDPHRGDY